MKSSPHIIKIAHGLLKPCTTCHGLGQLKGYKPVPLSVYEAPLTYSGVPLSIVITRCEECVGTGEKIDWDKWCQLKQDYPWHVIQEIEKIFDNYFQEIPS